ncbi:thrombospondin type 3 repeat-containing protein [Crocinitomix catalasitica]|uniref:thrombospondin type 3 repeat-containing protein n=1 Tax=Crocinitomix catalasitica TaxID=184607 RepID=UPI001FDF2F7B|nr:thrombospondin type 3 repeat-containing protein [Crocinitomix catalasitica]
MLLVTFSSEAKAQEDTLSQVFRPRIGLGTGVMTYYGEVQNYQKGFASTVNRFGGIVYANAPITRFFNLEFSATYAKIAANERTLTSNYNFESRIRMGSIMLYYNFYPFLKPNRGKFHPFIGAGFASFEFLSKTDLLDANGNRYHYWSDGSIMDMDENDPLAATDAVRLNRDYSYETDLRQLNADDLGKYKEQSFAFPLSAGFEWHMSPRWDFRLAATYYFTMTDLVDNISEAGLGSRQGDVNNDRFLFTNVTLSYDLFVKREGSEAEEAPRFDEDGLELYAGWDPNDFDKDGVIDALDKCPQTPIEALVDEFGCPLDEDKDGVPDYRDDEPLTPEGNYVDEFGVTLTEEDLADHLRRYYDSTGYEHDFVDVETEVILKGNEPGKGVDKEGKEGFKYVIIVGKEQKDVSVNDLHKFLGYKDYSTIVKDDTIYYTIGSFDNIDDAVAAKFGLEDQGVDVADIARSNQKTNNIVVVNDDVLEKVNKINIQTGKETVNYADGEHVFRVQLGAYRNNINTDKVFPGIDIVKGEESSDGINRFYTQAYDGYEEADKFRQYADKNGYPGAFVVVYENQKRITLKEAGIHRNELPKDYNEKKELETFVEEEEGNLPVDKKNKNGIDMSQVQYRIELAYFKGEVPVETVDILYNIGTIKPVLGNDGSRTYYSMKFNSEKERDDAMVKYAAYGLEDLKPVIEYQGKYYSPEEFEKLK